MNRYTFSLISLLIVVNIVSTACSSRDIKIQDPWSRPANVGGNSAVYFTIENQTSQADVLLRASSGIANAAELHLSAMEDNTMKMSPQDNIEVPAMSRVEFMVGGLHIMLIGLTQDLIVGDSFALTLYFQKAGEINLIVPVK